MEQFKTKNKSNKYKMKKKKVKIWRVLKLKRKKGKRKKRRKINRMPLTKNKLNCHLTGQKKLIEYVEKKLKHNTINILMITALNYKANTTKDN